jgi:hypothetical protein
MIKDDAQAAEANRLYWKQAASVGEIANQLGISRRALYEVLQPRPAGVLCPRCGNEGVFVNRSAHAAGMARCLNCQIEIEAAAPAASEDVTDPEPHVIARTNGGPRYKFKVGIGSAALVGVVVGAVATLLLTHRE